MTIQSTTAPPINAAPPSQAASVAAGTPSPVGLLRSTGGSGPRLRPGVADVPRYLPGARTVRDDGSTIKLSSNENPYPPLPGVLQAAVAAAADLNRYPDLRCTSLVDALAAHHQVPAEHLAIGTGSVALLYQLAQCMAGPGDEVLLAWRSFEAYPIVASIPGARSVLIQLDAAERHDLTAMAEAITPATRMILLCSPNNPTGTVIGAQEAAAFLDRVPQDILVVMDEAYVDFVQDPTAADGLELYRRYSNVCVLRTFSKAYGLAGMRVGYAIAPTRVAQALRDIAVPFGVSAMAQAAAVASLQARQALLTRVRILIRERQRVADALRLAGWNPVTGEANFLWLRLGPRTAEIAARCNGAGVLVRPYPTDGVRITIGHPSENDRLIEALGTA